MLIRKMFIISLFSIVWLQTYLPTEAITPIISISKNLTRTKNYYIYFLILFYCNPYKFPKMFIIFYISRSLNTIIKNLVKQNRPYNDYPTFITYYKKKKDSYSFPSQSVQTMYIIYKSYNQLCSNYLIDLYFGFVLFILILTRLYRGLHYIHDIIFSIIMALVLFYFL